MPNLRKADKRYMPFMRVFLLIVLFTLQTLLLGCKQKGKRHTNTSNTIRFKSVQPDTTSKDKDSGIVRGYFDNDFDFGYNISLVELIANPRIYNGKRVMVTGFLKKENGAALFISETDALHGIGKNGVDIAFDQEEGYHKIPSEFDGKYVTVNGVFDINETGSMGYNSGGLRDISRIKLN